MNRREADFVVVGAGLAGLTAAALLSEIGEVLLLSKTPPSGSNSACAQGGIAAALAPDDNPGLHERDTLAAGAGLCRPDAVAELTRRAPDAIRWLVGIGVPFDRDGAGNLQLGLEGAHGRHRIVHAGGDATGRVVVEALVRHLAKCPRVELHTGVRAACLLLDRRGRTAGVMAAYVHGERSQPDGWDEPLVFLARRATVLATGGAGRLYARTTNPAGATGDGVALAYSAGAVIRNMEFVQFHPTALDAGENPSFLISEAVRGAGARLVDEDGRPLMASHPLGDLAPRDVVARAIERRMRDHGRVYLDARHIQAFPERFPTIYAECLRRGLDPCVDLIPVAPAAHFVMGGIAADLSGRTSLPGLYAVGEAANTGVHGANRLASNSLLECVVAAHRLAEAVREAPETADLGAVDLDSAWSRQYGPDGPDLLAVVGRILWSAAGIVRDEQGLRGGLRALAALGEAHPASAALCTAELILRSALERRESRGAHFRSDYPQRDPAWDGRDTVLQRPAPVVPARC